MACWTTALRAGAATVPDDGESERYTPSNYRILWVLVPLPQCQTAELSRKTPTAVVIVWSSGGARQRGPAGRPFSLSPPHLGQRHHYGARGDGDRQASRGVSQYFGPISMIIIICKGTVRDGSVVSFHPRLVMEEVNIACETVHARLTMSVIKLPGSDHQASLMLGRRI
ncbi:hypothetical protein BaRGS_00008462 [Batillaria attramentaria]|uniref:Uncharacterized protein n=1 Tax=Batillaria attramentaria TaxID=370345 RepID=A0ABD0LL30_9CAEN